MIILKEADYVIPGAKEWGMECYCLIDTEFPLGIYEKVLKVDSGNGCTIL